MTPGLCENCYKRPKFGTHKFCGKTCATLAAAKPARRKQSQPQTKAGPGNAGSQKGATAPQKAAQPCVYCLKKPKFNNFDYCGKSCAALAGPAQTKPPVVRGVSMTKQKTAQVPSVPSHNVPARLPPKAPKTPRAKAAAPQGDSTEEDEEVEEEEDGDVSTDLDAYPSNSESDLEEEPSGRGEVVPRSAAKNTSRGGKPGGIPRIPGTCAIPRCGKPSHVDANGVKANYCSMKHREEAVTLGLEAACIMCRRHPQSTSDYFCSSACRNQAMAKT